MSLEFVGGYHSLEMSRMRLRAFWPPSGSFKNLVPHVEPRVCVGKCVRVLSASRNSADLQRMRKICAGDLRNLTHVGGVIAQECHPGSFPIAPVRRPVGPYRNAYSNSRRSAAISVFCVSVLKIALIFALIRRSIALLWADLALRTNNAHC